MAVTVLPHEGAIDDKSDTNFQPVAEEHLEPGLDESLLQPYEKTILALLNTKPPGKNGKPGCHLVRLSLEAQESRRQWHNALEMRMATGRDLAGVRGIASHAVSNTVRVAMVLHLMDHPHLLAEEESELDLATWERAKMLGEYHLAEAVRIQRMADSMASSAKHHAAIKRVTASFLAGHRRHPDQINQQED
ncbi:MAG: DUF3987 domain-containing protein [Magnetococcales bacterium]|nr:DUF3987 domain-containing protein [Magnetococcales bacterium]